MVARRRRRGGRRPRRTVTVVVIVVLGAVAVAAAVRLRREAAAVAVTVAAGVPGLVRPGRRELAAAAAGLGCRVAAVAPGPAVVPVPGVWVRPVVRLRRRRVDEAVAVRARRP